MKKDDSRFRFEHTIYADLFLLKNEDRALQITQRVKTLRRELTAIEENLRLYKKHQGGLSLNDILATASSFLLQQEENSAQPESVTAEETEAHNYSPFHMGRLGFQPTQLQGAIEVLREYEKQTEAQIQKLEAQQKAMQEEIQKQYTLMKEYPYELHGILVHDGVAESGHYYSFILDPTTRQWYRYNVRVHAPELSRTTW